MCGFKRVRGRARMCGGRTGVGHQDERVAALVMPFEVKMKRQVWDYS